jgi:hypothetical protein
MADAGVQKGPSVSVGRQAWGWIYRARWRWPIGVIGIVVLLIMPLRRWSWTFCWRCRWSPPSSS